MQKLIAPGYFAGTVGNDVPIGHTLQRIGQDTDRSVSEFVAMYDRPRHEQLVSGIRQAGARVRSLLDGDGNGAIMAVTQAPVSTCWSASAAPRRGPGRLRCAASAVR